MKVSLKQACNNKLTTVTIGAVTLHFSFETVVGFQLDSNKPIVSENVWSATTGKHLNEIDGGDKKSRHPKETFDRMLALALDTFSL